MVIDGDVSELPTSPLDRITPIAGDAMARSHDPAGVSFDADAAPVVFDAGNYLED